MMKKISTFLQSKNSRFLLLGILAVLIIATPVGVVAEADPVDPIELLGRIIEFVRTILILVAVLFIIFGAFMFVTASGDDKKIDTARKAILYAFIAVVVAVVAHGVVVWLEEWAANG